MGRKPRSYLSSEDKKNISATFNMTRNQRRKVIAAARLEGVTLSEWLRRAVADRLDGRVKRAG